MDDLRDIAGAIDPMTCAEPGDCGFDPAKLQEAIQYAETEAETPWPYDLSEGLAASGDIEPPPWNEVLGPTKPRTGPNGVVVRGGKFVAAWGDVARADMTFSIAKSYLSILAGIALKDKLINDLDDPIRDYALDDGYDAPQNRGITWRHMLTQTSEWEGELWTKPDLIDRNRQVGAGADNSRKGQHRDLQAPGTYWEYNDVRVNRFSLSLMQLFRRPLPEVLRERVMDPIGASNDWEWHGYRNSSIELDGHEMQSVPGGSHWGGGLWISTLDHARVAQLILQKGQWQGTEIVPADYVEALRAPCDINAGYGLLWWLNPGQSYYSNAPESSFFAVGAGTSIIWLDPALDLAVVARWIDQSKINEFAGRFMASIE